MHMAALSAYYEVEGLDRQPELLAFARERNPSATIYQADMREFHLDKTYDAVTCLFSSIGYVQTLERLSQAIETMAKHLAPGRVLIVEPWFSPGGRLHRWSRWNGDCGNRRHEDREDQQHANRRETVGPEFRILDWRSRRRSPFHRDSTLGLFTHEEQLEEFGKAGLTVTHDPEGLIGRGLFIGRKA